MNSDDQNIQTSSTPINNNPIKDIDMADPEEKTETKPENEEIVYEPGEKEEAKIEVEPAAMADEKPAPNHTEEHVIPIKQENFARNAKDSSINDIFGAKNDDSFYPTSTTKTVGESHIEVQHYDIPSKRNVEEKPENPEDTPLPHPSIAVKPNTGLPMMNQVNSSRTLGIATTLSIIVLVLGFGGGFFGFKTISDRASVSADEITPVSTPKAIDPSTLKPTPSVTKTIVTPEDPLKSWSSYTNTKFKYSLKFPETWFSESINNAQADIVQLTSFKPVAGGSEIQSGYKVEINFQNSNNKLLKDWVKDNNIVGGYGTPVLTSLKVDGKDAFQQTITSNGKSIDTYVFQANKVMVISYYASEKDFDAGKKTYQDIVNSIKLL